MIHGERRVRDIGRIETTLTASQEKSDCTKKRFYGANRWENGENVRWPHGQYLKFRLDPTDHLTTNAAPRPCLRGPGSARSGGHLMGGRRDQAARGGGGGLQLRGVGGGAKKGGCDSGDRTIRAWACLQVGLGHRHGQPR